MALILKTQTPEGFDAPEAYSKVAQIHLEYDNEYGYFRVDTYKDKQARTEAKKPIKSETYAFNNAQQVQDEILNENGEVLQEKKVLTPSFSDLFSVSKLDENNPITVAYTYLKTRTDWQEAKDA